MNDDEASVSALLWDEKPIYVNGYYDGGGCIGSLDESLFPSLFGGDFTSIGGLTMLYALFFIGCVCLLFGVVYPAVMAVYWILFRRGKEKFMDFMKSI